MPSFYRRRGRQLSLGEPGRDLLFELDDVFGEFADPFGELVGCHGVIAEEIAERFFVDDDSVDRGRGSGVEFSRDGTGGGGELFEEFGSDGEQIAAGELEDFATVAEARSHDLGLVAELFVVVVDLRDGDDAGVFLGRVLFAGAFLVPVEDAADEGGDEGRFGFSAGNRLREAEEKSHVAMDLLSFEGFGGANPFPCRGEFDQDAAAGDACLFVEGDELFCFRDAPFCVVGEAGIDFCRDAAWDDFEDFEAEVYEELIEGPGEALFGVGRFSFSKGDRVGDEVGVFRLFGSGEDQRWVCRSISGVILFDFFEFASVGNDGGEFFEFVEFAHRFLVVVVVVFMDFAPLVFADEDNRGYGDCDGNQGKKDVLSRSRLGD